MKRSPLLLTVLLAASSLPAAGQAVEPWVRQAPAAPPAPAAAAEKPEPDCVCDRYNYKPLSAKGTAAQEYWDARRKARVARAVSGVAALFGVLAQSGGALNAAQDTYGRALEELRAARAQAEAAGAVKVVGEDLEEESLKFLLKVGVDYELTP